MLSLIGELVFCPLLIVTAPIKYSCLTDEIELVPLELAVAPTATGINRKFNTGLDVFNSLAINFATLNE